MVILPFVRLLVRRQKDEVLLSELSDASFSWFPPHHVVFWLSLILSVERWKWVEWWKLLSCSTALLVIVVVETKQEDMEEVLWAVLHSVYYLVV